jgi:response regulator RpfG family c-di-GMP phosphodiesterase
MVKAEERKRQAISQTVEALVKAIEFTDPYLAGHSILMRDVSSLLAEKLKLSPEDKATVEIASHLSQIGKIFIDKAVLTKWTSSRKRKSSLVQRHCGPRLDILARPTRTAGLRAVYQMNERRTQRYPQAARRRNCMQARVLSVPTASAP